MKAGIPTYDELEEVAGLIGKQWKKLGRRLGVSDAELEEIDHAHDQISEKGYHMLKHWEQGQGVDATYQALHDALLHPLIRRLDIAEKLCYY